MSDPQRPYYDPKAKKDTLATKLVRCILKPAEVDGDLSSHPAESFNALAGILMILTLQGECHRSST